MAKILIGPVRGTPSGPRSNRCTSFCCCHLRPVLQSARVSPPAYPLRTRWTHGGPVTPCTPNGGLMKFSGHFRRRYLHRLTTIAVAAAIGGPFAVAPASAAVSPPAPDVLIAPATELAQGANILYTQDFTGTSTQAGDWISGGSACLTAASGKGTGGIPACDWKSPDKQGS